MSSYGTLRKMLAFDWIGLALEPVIAMTITLHSMGFLVHVLGMVIIFEFQCANMSLYR